LIPTTKDEFKGLITMNYKRDKTGIILGFTVDAGRVKNLKFVKMKE
jgi:hypothetical protein